MTRVFIDGAAGTTGLEIEARLNGRSEFDLIVLPDDRRKDASARREALNAADVVILCLPDNAARDAVAMIGNAHVRVIDASTAHRIAPGWTYGFPELGHDVAGAMRVSNPGCYPTGFLALAAPLVRAGLLPRDTRIAVNAVSGYSGGGKSMIAEFESGTASAWQTYALTLAHKHVDEMRVHAGLDHAPLFSPSVANTYHGMIVDIPLFDIDAVAAREALTRFYDGSSIVAVRDFDDANLSVEHAADSDRIDLFVFANTDGSQIRLTAALDNLGKGAAGAAVQSLNLMTGLPETTGLRLP